MVKDYLQLFSIDCDQIFAAVIKPMAFQVLFAIVVIYNLGMDQIDVKTAFFITLLINSSMSKF